MLVAKSDMANRTKIGSFNRPRFIIFMKLLHTFNDIFLQHIFFGAMLSCIASNWWGTDGVPLSLLSFLDDWSGRNKHPNIAQFNTTPDKMSNVTRHPYSWLKWATRGARMNVPNPEPDTAVPFIGRKKWCFQCGELTFWLFIFLRHHLRQPIDTFRNMLSRWR